MALKAMEAAKVAAPTKKAVVSTAKAKATAKNQQCYKATAKSKVAVAVTAARAAAPAKAMLANMQCDIQTLAPILDPDELMKKACQDALAGGSQKGFSARRDGDASAPADG